MKLLFTIALIGAAVVLLGPVIAAGVGFAVMIGCALLWFLPFVLITFSDRASGGEKIAWILLMIFFSWFAWIFYFLLAPISRRHAPQPRYYRRSRQRGFYRDREYRY
jgi:hypothetical protein